MADEITLAQLDAKQKVLMALAEQLQTLAKGEGKGQQIAALAPRLEKEGKELDQMAKQFEAQQLAKQGPQVQVRAEVMLTYAQSLRIWKQTGVTIQSVRLRDEGGVMSRSMPTTDPQTIELWALQEAQRQQMELQAQTILRAQLEKLLADLESKSPALAGKVAELRADPKFGAGLLHKKP